MDWGGGGSKGMGGKMCTCGGMDGGLHVTCQF